MRTTLWMLALAGCSNGLNGLNHVDDGADGHAPSRYHPDGYAEPLPHGQELKLQQQDCRACHGDDLSGGSSGVSCDGCHTDGWRTDCTFCHGGVDADDGAPPQGIDDTLPDDALRFRAHAQHLDANTHAPVPCDACHLVPLDVLSPGHVFDDTPGVAEVAMGSSLSPAGTWTGTSCSNLYCHSTGRNEDGAIDASAPPQGCDDCHADASIGTDWLTMSLRHSQHLITLIGCAQCHARVAASNSAIADPTLHVDGQVQVDLASGTLTYNSNGTCSGLCHLKLHFNARW